MCWKCLNNIEVEEPVSRSAECPVCHKDLHSCKNCVYYAPGSHYDCHETIEEIVVDKEKANFCDSFKLKRQFAVSSVNGGSASQDKINDAKKAFESLFGN